jgi:LysM repeat protein
MRCSTGIARTSQISSAWKRTSLRTSLIAEVHPGPLEGCHTAGIIPAMTERGLPLVDGAPACPFVAFEDDRDERASSPDHRHRCYAEIRPAPRALAHQEAYCLSSAFPVCPTFQDWARREAAKARAGEAEVEDAPRRNPPREWSAPPPWTADAENEDDADRDDRRGAAAAGLAGAALGGAALGGGAVGAGAGASSPDPGVDTSAPDFLTGRSRAGAGVAGSGAGLAGSGAGLAGSPADRLAAGEPVGEAWPSEQAQPTSRSVPPSADRYPDRPGNQAVAADDWPSTPERVEAFDEFEPEEGRPAPPSMPARSQGRGLIDRRPRVGETRRTRPPVDASGPSWEQPRRYEAYPTLRTRMGLPSIPRVALAAVALGIAAIALFSLPTLLGLGQSNNGGGVVSSPSSTTRSSAGASVAPSARPAASQQIYVVKAGDNLGKIAKKFKTTIDAILRANPQIKDPNKIKIGDEITIPTKGASTGAQPSESAAP